MSAHKNTQYVHVDYKYQIDLRLRSIGERGQETYYECPFCGSKEKSKFSVNYSKEVFKCYKCNSQGHVSKLLRHLGVSSSSIKKDSYDLKLDSIIEKERVEKKVSNKKVKFNGTLYNTYETETGETIHENVPVSHTFTYRDEIGEELYQRHVGQSKEWSNKKQKYKKIVRPTYKENGVSFLGGRPDNIKVFYGLESIKEKGVCLIFEGEKKRDYFEKILAETLGHETETPFFSLSGSGASQKIDQKTIQALKDKNVVQVFLVPDIDDIGEKFAQETRDTLKQNGLDSSILFLGSYLPKEKTPFKGYDIEDLLKEYPNKIYDILKYIKTLPRKKTIHSRYLTQSISSDSILSDPSRIVINKGIQGTGKTRLFEEINKAEKVLYVSIRESLCKDASERIGLEFYLNIENANFCRDYTEGLAVCLNSIHKFQYIIDHAFEFVVCIDEIDHTIKDLMTSPLFNKKENIEFRSKTFNILVKLIKEAKKVILTSADIPDYVFQFLKEAGLDDILFIENTYKDKKDYIKYFQFTKILKDIVSSLTTEEKVSVSIANKREAKKIIRYVHKRLPDKKILFLEQDKTQEQARILKERDFGAYDLIIYTPTIFTGIDFDIDFGDKHFCIITNNRTVNHFEILQSCFRFRRAKEIHFFIKDIKGTRETDRETIKYEAMKRREEFSKYGSESGELNYTMRELYTTIESENRKSKNSLSSEFEKLVLSRLENVSQFRIVSEKTTEEEKLELKEIAIELKDSEKEEIFCSNKLSDDRMSELEGGSYYKNEKEKYSKQKTEYINFTNIDPEENEEEFKELLDTPIETLKKNVFNTKNLVTPIENLIETDNKNISSYVGDDNFITLKTIATQDILKTLSPSIDFTSKDSLLSKPITIDENGILDLTCKLIDSEYRKTLSVQLGIKETQKASYLMRTVLDSLGWARRSSKHKVKGENRRVNRYHIDLKSIEKLFKMGGCPDE